MSAVTSTGHTLRTMTTAERAACWRHASVCAAVVLISATAACTRTPPAPPLPPTTAPPEQVLDRYLSALVAHDCATAHSLATGTFVKGNGELCGVVTVSAYTPPQLAPRRIDTEAVFSSQLSITGGDESLPDGQRLWCWVLDQQPDNAWRLTAGGSLC